jgi:hypothetical protein
MWTLILVTLLVSGASTGGVGTATAFLDFPDATKCRAAATAMAAIDRVLTSETACIRIYHQQRSIALLPNA